MRRLLLACTLAALVGACTADASGTAADDEDTGSGGTETSIDSTSGETLDPDTGSDPDTASDPDTGAVVDATIETSTDTGGLDTKVPLDTSVVMDTTVMDTRPETNADTTVTETATETATDTLLDDSTVACGTIPCTADETCTLRGCGGCNTGLGKCKK